MQEQKSLLDRIKPGKATKQEYAERPFDFFTIMRSGVEITIEESYDWETDKPRVVKVKGFKDSTKTFEKIAFKATDGIFKKDLLVNEDEYAKLMAAFPSTLNNLIGVTFRITRGNGLDSKVEYLRVAPYDMDGKPYRNTQDAPGQPTPSASNQSDLCRQLSHAIELNFKMGLTTDREKLNKMADAISPGKGLDLIVSAKTEGWIYEKDGIFRGE